MASTYFKTELRWERSEGELGLEGDLLIARMLLATPAHRRAALMAQSALGERWQFTPATPPTRRLGMADAVSAVAVNLLTDAGDPEALDLDEDDFDDCPDEFADAWPSKRCWSELPQSRVSATRLERFLRKVIADRTAALEALGERPFEARLAALRRRLHLGPAEVAMLRFCALVRHDEGIAENANRLNHWPRKVRASMMAHALDVSLDEYGRALRVHSGLARFGLVDPEEDGLPSVESHPLCVVLDGLLDRDQQGRDPLAGLMRPLPESERVAADFDHLSIPLDTLRAAIEDAWATGRRGCNLLLHGAPGHGKTQIARLLAGSLQAAAFEVPVEDEDGDQRGGESRTRSAALCQHAMAGLERPLLVFDEAEDVFPVPSLSWLFDADSRPQKGWINSLLEGTRVPTIWIANQVGHIDAAILRRFDLILEVPAPPRAVRSRLIEDALPADAIGERWRAELLALENLSPAELNRLARVRGYARHGQAGERLLRKVFEEARKAAGLALRTDILPLPTRYSLQTVNADVDLDAIARHIEHTGRARLCLHGPPGSGKTGYVQHLAQRLGRPLHIRRASDLLGPYVGQTEQLLASAFASASQDGAVLLIDEVDSFLQDRERAERQWEITAVNELLTQIERFEGVLAVCTNRYGKLDGAALRRFDLKIRFGCLDANQRRVLFDEVTRSLGLTGSMLQTEAAHARLGRLDRLTPGAFETVTRRHEFAPFGDVVALVEALESEQVDERSIEAR